MAPTGALLYFYTEGVLKASPMLYTNVADGVKILVKSPATMLLVSWKQHICHTNGNVDVSWILDKEGYVAPEDYRYWAAREWDNYVSPARLH